MPRHTLPTLGSQQKAAVACEASGCDEVYCSEKCRVCDINTHVLTCGARKNKRKDADTDAAEYYSREIRLRLARCAANGAGAEGACAGGALHVAVRFVAAVLAAFPGKEPTNKLGECGG